MKEIIKNYGNSIIAGIIAISIISLIYIIPYNDGAGVFRAIGTIISGNSDDYLRDNYGTCTYEKYKENYINQIMIKDNIAIQTNRKLLASDFFDCKEAKFDSGSLNIIGVLGDNGESIQVLHENKVDYFYFEEPGIYRVFFAYSNAYGNKSYGSVFIPVNRESEALG